MKTALITYLGSTIWPKSCPSQSPAAERFCLMAAVVDLPSVTYPSDCISWWGHPGGCRGGLTGLWFSTCGRYSPLQTKENINQAQDTQEVVWIETPLYPRSTPCWKLCRSRQRAVEAWEIKTSSERSNIRDITVALEQFFTSCGVSC